MLAGNDYKSHHFWSFFGCSWTPGSQFLRLGPRAETYPVNAKWHSVGQWCTMTVAKLEYVGTHDNISQLTPAVAAKPPGDVYKGVYYPLDSKIIISLYPGYSWIIIVHYRNPY